MQRKAVLGHAETTRILAAARAEALANHWAVSIAVVDDGGHLLGLERLDGAASSTAYLAPEKARTSAMSGRESKYYQELVNNGHTAFVSVKLMTCLEGAVPIVFEGQVIGAVGVSGVKSEFDAQIARAGAAALA
ncbi:MAG: heme-binding protein [Pseudomonas sp.]|uniref:heme-binding protein n=1 Tax=Pseudomonas abieticivorans TaxID=2931382 RepID=UPI0020C1582C|nr:heme-binding protein [Pseudomonas sp. PIA16]MDE1168896.1 heme-binding protein [Pseudomonas sp.]